MSTADNKRSVVVAIFVALGILIFLAGIFILGGQQKRFESTVRIKAVFDDVEGLRKGNNVWFSGVKVGTVKDIKFYGKSQVEITMRVEEDVKDYIRKDSKVKLASESLIGNKILVIFGGSTSAPVIENGDRLEVEKPGVNTDDLMATLQENNKNLVSITNDFKELSSRLVEGKGTVGALLGDSTMATSFQNVVLNLEKVSKNTLHASGALNQFTSKLNTEGGMANELLTDTTVFRQLKASVAQLKESSASVAEMSSNLNTASNKLNTDNSGIGVLLNDEKFAAQLKSTMGNLETSTDKLDENMEALQHNFLLRGYFKKKAKNEAKEKNTDVGLMK